MKKLNIVLASCILGLFATILTIFLTTNTYAWTYDEDTNEVISDNVFDMDKIERTIFTTTNNTNGYFRIEFWDISETQLKGLLNSSDIHITLETNVYKIKVGLNGNTQDDKIWYNGTILLSGEYTANIVYNEEPTPNNINIKTIMINEGNTQEQYEPYGTYVDKELYDTLKAKYEYISNVFNYNIWAYMTKRTNQQ